MNHKATHKVRRQDIDPLKLNQKRRVGHRPLDPSIRQIGTEEMRNVHPRQ